MGHHQVVCRVFRGAGRFRGWVFSQSLIFGSFLRSFALVTGSQTRLKPHFVGTRPDDGSDTQLHLQVQEVVPHILEKQVLKKRKMVN